MSSSRDVSAGAAAPGAADTGRIVSIDRFRGLLVVLMVVGNYLSGVSAVPASLKHTPDIGLTIVDIGAPCFVFAMGLTYGASFHRRAQSGLAAAYGHFVVRYLALIGIGAILTSGGTQLAAQPSDWGVLQALGVAGLVCLPFIRLGTTLRFAIGAAILVGYQILLDATALDTVRASVQGGIVGGLSWGALLAAAALGFLLVDLLSRALPVRPGFFAWWGENALLLYLLHLVLLGVVVAPGASWWYADAPLWLVTAQLVTILGVLSAVAWWLHHRGIRLGL
jgi:predicted acyltransferase